MKADIPLADALLLWNSGHGGDEPAFVVRPLGHDDYYRYNGQTGACLAAWQRDDERGRQLRLLVEAWHIVAFEQVPIALVHDGLLVIPEYRNMLADDCLPKQFRGERG